MTYDKQTQEISDKLCDIADINTHSNRNMITKAVDFCIKYHGSQLRQSGDPYFSHPVAVATILAELGLDAKSIITGLLHDVIEDTEATHKLISYEFGEDIATLVEGVTKLTQIKFRSDNSKQASNFRKLILAISQDLRVLMVKLADRLHNMRTLHFISKEAKRHRIARETMDIYAPIAGRVGMDIIKKELEDLSFQNLSPDAFELINNRLDFIRKTEGDVKDKVIRELQQLMHDNGVIAEVLGREKSPSSIWRKMKAKNVDFSQINDIIAFRIIVDREVDCYHTLGVIHRNYHIVPTKFKDYISTPKANGYRSLHTVIIGPAMKKIEIQIRTYDMQQVAEYGIAAHWSYKQGGSHDANYENLGWIKEILDIDKQASEVEEFFENTKIQMHDEKTYCFTPNGKVIALPSGATSIDFAFAVHSKLGYSCVGTKINGKIMPLRTILKSGDQVEIISSPKAKPMATWESFVVTGKARSEIRKFIRNKEKDEFTSLGQRILQKIFTDYKHEYSEDYLEPHLEHYKCNTVDDILHNIGSGKILLEDIKKVIFPQYSKSGWQKLLDHLHPHKGEHISRMPISGLTEGVAIHYCQQCFPLPGEKIVGEIEPEKGVNIHNIECSHINDNYETIPVKWNDRDKESQHIARINILCLNKVGLLGKIARVIGNHGGNIHNLTIPNRGEKFYTMVIDVEVSDIEHLNDIIGIIRALYNVREVTR